MFQETLSPEDSRLVTEIPTDKGKYPERAQPQVVTAPESLVVHHLPGHSKRLVVSLAGVGKVRTMAPAMEFLGTASDYCNNHVLLVSDITRSWLNGPDITNFIVDLISRYREKHDIEDLVLLGNSMGGFSALVLADLVPTNTVIAMAPQFSANPAIVCEEPRWTYHRNKIAAWKHQTVGPIQQKNTNYFVFHGDDALEIPHWARFPRGKTIHHFIVKGEGHNVAVLLRRRKALRPVFHAAIDGKPRRVRKIMERQLNDDRFKVFYRSRYEAEYPEATAKYQPYDATAQTVLADLG